ncbi:hypothetical protein TSAR_008173 [Trichomalopsis sarcophagae]|uniref:Uncharacterized protein n=1 Tax=Trichomalopsis sarcophagae TaxID=543379 RepID=A0A232EIG8_9HYME|nr:hypothetical protein TSAR_008173 [Trichomalopsis sarcophagae]
MWAFMILYISTVPAKSSKHFASFKKKNLFQNHPRKLSRKHIWYITPRCARPKAT